MSETQGEGVENIATEVAQSDDISMYRLPGDPPLIAKDIKLYISSNDKLRTSLGRIVSRGLANPDPSIHRIAARLLPQLSEEERSDLRPSLVPVIEKDLNDPDFVVRRDAVRLIAQAPVDRRDQLIAKAKADHSLFVSGAADRLVVQPLEEDQGQTQSADDPGGTEAAPISQEDPTLLPAQIEEGLADPNPFSRRDAVRRMSKVPESQRSQLIKKGMADAHPVVRAEAAELLLQIPEAQVEHYRHTDPEFLKKLEAVAVTTPLYNQVGDKKFLHYDFFKSGSGLTLLDSNPGSDKSFRNRVIKRTIPMDAYFEWKKAYEAVDAWKAMGFDYVPVEPIVKAEESKEDMQVDVHARVLQGPDAPKWFATSKGLHDEHVRSVIDDIKFGLFDMGIEHGNNTNNNFVVVFDKNAEGKPDLAKPPRVYIIDFDAAKS